MGASLGMLAGSTRRMRDRAAPPTRAARRPRAPSVLRGRLARAAPRAPATRPARARPRRRRPRRRSSRTGRANARASENGHRRRFRPAARASRALPAPLVHDLELAALERAPAPRARDLARGRLPRPCAAAAGRRRRGSRRARARPRGARRRRCPAGRRRPGRRPPRRAEHSPPARPARPRLGVAKAALQPPRSTPAHASSAVLDVLRVVVAAADDDEVLQPAADEELAAVHEAEVARAQITHRRAPPPAPAAAPGAAPRSASRASRPPKSASVLRHVPVAFRAARRAHPHLADAVVREPLGALGRDDRDVDAARGRVAAADHARDGRALARRALGPSARPARPQHLLVDELHSRSTSSALRSTTSRCAPFEHTNTVCSARPYLEGEREG